MSAKKLQVLTLQDKLMKIAMTLFKEIYERNVGFIIISN
jgi:hypothetical protein